MRQNNLILLADAYKYSHHKLYYPGTTKVYSYLESRGGKFDNTVFYGLQYFLKEYLEGMAFTQQDLDEAEPFLKDVFGRDDVFDKDKFQYILDKHNGKLPVRIKAVPEGTAVGVKNVLMTIENTDPNCYWLTNFLETILMQVWYPSTVATISREVKKVISQFFNDTASEGSEAGIEYVLNDFGFRGVSSVESAGLGGSAHLINFRGSDTLAGSVLARRFYNTDQVYGNSIPATEHSICTLLGESGELELFKHVLNTFPTGLVACVSDSYDIFRACDQYWGENLKAEILDREGVLVIRPDSGDPIMTLLRIFDILFEKFGFTVNEKGYKVLPSQIRVIQGDGVNYEAIIDIYAALKNNGISAENLVLGMGGALLQKLDRDTQKYALKCSYAEINGEEVIVQKRPVEMDENGKITSSFKRSKGGRLKLIKQGDEFITVSSEDYPLIKDELVTVFEDGQVVKEYTFEEVRENAKVLNKALVL
ncbi:nicotinate phosphoribosyltransferase [Marinigracilibium pacificum]|uniref:Nicotinamide phosphoribosyltransferase n=1 Tax=Marinigracilibium pacificum TaxID=2729599 RepID=A0A848IZD9_9BACT|nr:nicotinate phosphoribosyltransferase [Marinigracilibium pacificum]NMM49903.1 nicotinate phosphoribosyltransferase [Marinigracilibium pacificum]